MHKRLIEKFQSFAHRLEQKGGRTGKIIRHARRLGLKVTGGQLLDEQELLRLTKKLISSSKFKWSTNAKKFNLRNRERIFELIKKHFYKDGKSKELKLFKFLFFENITRKGFIKNLALEMGLLLSPEDEITPRIKALMLKRLEPLEEKARKIDELIKSARKEYESVPVPKAIKDKIGVPKSDLHKNMGNIIAYIWEFASNPLNNIVKIKEKFTGKTN